MNKYINKPNNNNIMNKIIIFILMFFSLMAFANAVIVETDYDTNFNRLGVLDVVGTIGGDVLTNANDSVGYNIKMTNEYIYLALISQTGQNETISYSVTGQTEVNNFIIRNDRVTYLSFKPQFVGENFGITLGVPSGQISYEWVVFNDNSRDVTRTIFSPLITGVMDLIEINISIWKILYYLFIATIILSVITGIVILAYRFYVWADKVNIYERKRSNFKK